MCWVSFFFINDVTTELCSNSEATLTGVVDSYCSFLKCYKALAAMKFCSERIIDWMKYYLVHGLERDPFALPEEHLYKFGFDS